MRASGAWHGLSWSPPHAAQSLPSPWGPDLRLPSPDPGPLALALLPGEQAGGHAGKHGWIRPQDAREGAGSEPRLEGGVQPRPAPPAHLGQCSPCAGPWWPCPHLLLGLPPHLPSPHLAQLVPLASWTARGPVAVSLPLILRFLPPAPCAFPFLPCELVHTAWGPTPRPDFSVAWAGAAPWVQGGRDVAPEPGGTARAATGPFPDQAETRWVARRGLIPPKRALRPVASLPRTHGAQPGDILGGQNQALRARGRQGTGAV